MNDAAMSPLVGIAGHGGMPGMPDLPRPPERQISPTIEDTSPPPRVGLVVVDEVYHKVGFANDLVFARASDGRITVSDFHVMFNRRERAGGGPPKAPLTLSTIKKAVHTYINGKLQPQLYLRVQDNGSCSFPDGRSQPPAQALAGGLGLVPGVNTVRFEIRYLRDPRVFVAECSGFLWEMNAPIIVVDIDGTITRSDVRGLLMTFTPRLILDHTHAGICKLLDRMAEEEGVKMVYLTSRPIVLAPKTRAFLISVEQGGKSLPLGPLLCSLEKVSGVLWRELVAKDMHAYKIDALLGLARPFREAGRPFGQAVFAAGIGNKVHDAVAYKAAGIPEDFIFLIDPDSSLRAWDGDTSQFGGSAEGKTIVPQPQHQQQQRQPSRSLRTNNGSRNLVGRDSANSSSCSRASGVKANQEDEKEEEIVVLTAAPTPDRSRERPLSTIEEMPQFLGSVSDARRKEGQAGREPTAPLAPRSAGAAATSPPVPSSSRPTSQQQPAAGSFQEISLGSIPQGNVSLSSSSISTTGYTGTSSSRPVPKLRYQSYGDEHFFPRLRASLNPADWEAMKAAESAEREARIAAAAAETKAARTLERSQKITDSEGTVGVREEIVEAPKGQFSTE